MIDEEQVAQIIAVNQTMETDLKGKDVSQSKISATPVKQQTPDPSLKNVLNDDEPKKKSKKKKKGKKAKK